MESSVREPSLPMETPSEPTVHTDMATASCDECESTSLMEVSVETADEPPLHVESTEETKEPPPPAVLPSTSGEFSQHVDASARCRAVVLSHKRYEFNWQTTRHGNEEDERRLQETLPTIGFDVEIHRDLTREQVKQTIQEVRDTTSSAVPWLWLIVLTHGAEHGTLCAYDRGSYYTTRSIWGPFENYERLQHVPILFLFQACRGTRSEQKTPAGPEDADFYINRPAVFQPRGLQREDSITAYSTAPETMSARHKLAGSWYITQLCKVLGQLQGSMDIFEILTLVHHDMGGCIGRDVADSECFQTAIFSSTMTRSMHVSKSMCTPNTYEPPALTAEDLQFQYQQSGEPSLRFDQAVITECEPCEESTILKTGVETCDTETTGYTNLAFDASHIRMSLDEYENSNMSYLVLYFESYADQAREFQRTLGKFCWPLNGGSLMTDVETIQDDINFVADKITSEDLSGIVIAILAPITEAAPYQTDPDLMCLGIGAKPMELNLARMWGPFVSCAYLQGKPKVFLFLDPLDWDHDQAVHEEYTDFDPAAPASSRLNSDFFFFYGLGTQIVSHLISILGQERICLFESATSLLRKSTAGTRGLHVPYFESSLQLRLELTHSEEKTEAAEATPFITTRRIGNVKIRRSGLTFGAFQAMEEETAKIQNGFFPNCLRSRMCIISSVLFTLGFVFAGILLWQVPLYTRSSHTDISAAHNQQNVATHTQTFNESEVMDNFVRAAEIGNLTYVRVKLDAGVNPNVTDSKGRTALTRSSFTGHLPVVELLLERGADVNSDNDGTWTALHAAAQEGHLNIVKLLLERGAAVNTQSMYGSTPLHVAVLRGQISTAQELLKHGANISARNRNGNTPLHFAAEQSDGRIAHLLLNNGADIQARDKNRFTALHRAAEFGQTGVMMVLMERGADINARSNENTTPLYLAAFRGQIEAVKLLLNHSAEMDVKDKYGNTALDLAARFDHASVAELLLEKGASVLSKNDQGFTHLHSAAQNGFTAVMKTLLNRGADINARSIQDITPLYMAAENGHVEAVKLLLNHSAEVDVKDKYGNTALDLAARFGHNSVVELLLDNGANVSSKNNGGYTPLHSAGENNHIAAMQILLERGADINARSNDNTTPLYLVALNGQVEAVNLLLNHSAKVDLMDKYGNTALTRAAENGLVSMVELLLDKGAKVSSKNNGGFTPLHIAAGKNQTGAMQTLLNRGADVNARSNGKITPLHMAAWPGLVKAVKLLLNHRTEVDVKDIDGDTALSAAAWGGHTSVVKLLLENGSNLDPRNNKGFTPLHAAADNGHIDVINVLLERGADINVRTKDDYTPLYLAAWRGHVEAVKLLLDRGAQVNVRDKEGKTAVKKALEEGHTAVVELLKARGGVE